MSKSGLRLRLEEKPARLLAYLISHQGQLVTREELRGELWDHDVNLDFEHGLNKAVNKLRTVLADDASEPRYLETLSRRGYRFTGNVEFLPDDADRGAAAENRVALSEEQVRAVGQPKNAWPRRLVWVTIGCALMAAVGWLFALSGAKDKQVRGIRAVLPLGEELQLLTTGGNTGVVLAPDSSEVVFSTLGDDGQRRLSIRRLDSRIVKEIPGTVGGYFPFWSPDGGQVGFFTDTELRKVNLSDGNLTSLCSLYFGRGGTWSKDGVILFAKETNGPIYEVPESVGAPHAVTQLGPPYTTHRWPEFLPDGKHFVFLAASHDDDSEPAAIFLGELGSSTVQFVTHSSSGAKPARGNLLFVSSDKLISQPFDLASGSLRQEGTVLAEDVQYDSGTWYGSFTASSNALIYFSRPQIPREWTIGWFDATGKFLANAAAPTLRATSGRISPDGKLVAMTCGDPGNNVCVIREDGAVTRITNQSISSTPAWSPDGLRLAYQTHRATSQYGISIKGLNESAPEDEVLVRDLRAETVRQYNPADVQLRLQSWHRDGKHLLLWETEQDLSVLDLTTRKLVPYLKNIIHGDGGDFSPDGKWVAYASKGGGNEEIYIASYPNPKTRYLVGQGHHPRWSRDGSELFFKAGLKVYAARVQETASTLSIGTVRLLPLPPNLALVVSDTLDVDAGGKFLLSVQTPGSASDLVLITNW